MACVNGRVNPDAQTKLRLFSDSAGHCNRPDCRRPLFSDEKGEDYHIGEMAHIVAAQDKGPRADKKIEAKVKAEYKNLILLCPSCHTEIDKAPDTFSVELLLEWKANHRRVISDAIGIAKMDKRAEARAYVEKILLTNREIHKNFSPNTPESENPESEMPAVWKRKMLSQIIPNNQKILLFLDANQHLLTPEEKITLEGFRQHVDDLIQRHMGEEYTVGKQFPAQMEKILG